MMVDKEECEGFIYPLEPETADVVIVAAVNPMHGLKRKISNGAAYPGSALFVTKAICTIKGRKVNDPAALNSFVKSFVCIDSGQVHN